MATNTNASHENAGQRNSTTDSFRPATSPAAALPPPLSAKDPKGFAYKTLRERLAVILTRAMDTVSGDAAEIERQKGPEARQDIQVVVERLAKLRDEITANKPLIALEDDFQDAAVWNAVLQQYTVENKGCPPRWYLLVTHSLIHSSLWGNRCDLSLSCGADASGQAGSLLKTDALRSCIISDHTDQLWEHLVKLRQQNLGGKPTQLHCVMDNSGYELAADLALFDFLHASGFVAAVTIHVKAIPWYVSDVMRRDLSWTLRKMRECDHEATRALGERCQRRIDEGVWSVLDDIFWTQPFDYAQMATRRPGLYKLLQSADLVLFKGDVNYRKLVGDLEWDPSVPFHQVLRGFDPTFLCTLRTIKSNTVAGVDRSVVRDVAQRSADWMITGEYAVLQCAGVTA
ncbi:hypothetical protein V5799_016789 [Amblyomma americanum]|uniref:Sugar phosphate phosphatase n=1 Tax=Amblyomma americanum TaxID=6943 RepID=A0AAQ4F3Z4_AMBAM